MSRIAQNTKIIGAAMLPVIESVLYDDVAHILEAHDLSYIDPEQWYPAQIWINVLNDIGRMGSGMFDLIGIGKQTVMMSPVEEGVTLPQALFGLDEAMQQMHQGPYGSIQVEQPHERRIDLIFNTPYPADLWYGVVYQIAVNYAPEGASSSVTYEDFADSRYGDRAHRIIVEW